MAKATWIFSLWVSFVCTVFFWIYILTGYSVGWMAFCALALYFAQNGSPKTLPNFLCSAMAGVVWGWINLWVVGTLMEAAGLSYLVAVLIDVMVLTTLAMGVHLVLLKDTWFNNMPYVFLGVALTFSGTPSLQIAACLICGLVVSAICTLGGDVIYKKFAPPPPEESKINETIES